MVENVLEYKQLNDENVVGIIYMILNAESRNVDRYDTNFRKLSSHQISVNGVEYHPCALTMEHSGHDSSLPMSPTYEIQRLYEQNTNQRDVFWRGVERVLEDLITGSGSFNQSYSLGEFLESFYDLGRTSTRNVSDKLRKLVDGGKLKGREAYKWSPGEHPWPEGVSEIKMPCDTHHSLVMALAIHQQGISSSYWLEKIELEPGYFLAHFTGLGHSDVSQAEAYLEQNRGNMALSNDSVEMRLRGIKRRLAKP